MIDMSELKEKSFSCRSSTYRYDNDATWNQFAKLFDREIPTFDTHEIIKSKFDNQMSFCASLNFHLSKFNRDDEL